MRKIIAGTEIGVVSRHKAQHWRAFQDTFGREAAPVLVLALQHYPNKRFTASASKR